MNRLISISKSIGMATVLLSSTVMYAASVQAETIEGKMNGLDCASHGETCPTDRLDPHIAVERDFVVQTSNGKYYFITNLDRAIKARHALEMVRVEGQMSSKFDAMRANELYVKQGGNYNLVWSVALQVEEQNKMYGTQPDKDIDK